MRFTVSALVVAGAAAFAPMQQAARPSTSLRMVDTILKKHTGQAALDPSVVAQYANLALPTDKGELLFIGSQAKVCHDADKHMLTRCVGIKISSTSILCHAF